MGEWVLIMNIWWGVNNAPIVAYFERQEACKAAARDYEDQWKNDEMVGVAGFVRLLERYVNG